MGYRGHALHNSKNRISPLDVEVLLIKQSVCLTESIFGNDIHTHGQIRHCQVDGLLCLVVLLDPRTQVIYLGFDVGFAVLDATFAKEGAQSILSDAVQLVVGRMANGTVRLCGFLMPLILVSWGVAAGIDLLVEVWVGDVELVGVDADDGSCTG